MNLLANTNVPTVVRFAPSPTGMLHIGGARTALYNWLFAKQNNGKMYLRIEDTDRVRSTKENVDQILDALSWLGLDYDGMPISQFNNRDRHLDVIQQLLSSDKAYMLDGAVMLRVPDTGSTIVHDQIRGTITFDHAAIKDFTIARSDGSPLYNLASVIDDVDMNVTDVIRGEDHLSNTPRQVMILNAMGYSPPRYAHLPLLNGSDGKKLSKRHDAASVQDLRDAGYLPAAVRNYIALLGWGYDDKQTIFATDELIKLFSLKSVSKSPAIFDTKKLTWMNGDYIRNTSIDELNTTLQTYLDKTIDFTDALLISQTKLKTLNDFWPMNNFFFNDPVIDPIAKKKFLDANGMANLLLSRDVLTSLDTWDHDAIKTALDDLLLSHGIKPIKLFQPIRVAISGTTISPGIHDSLTLLGKTESLKRINLALS